MRLFVDLFVLCRSQVRPGMTRHCDGSGSGEAFNAIRLAYIDKSLDFVLGSADFDHDELLADVYDFAPEHLDQRENLGAFFRRRGNGYKHQISRDHRLAYKILRNADCLPPELELKKEIRQMEDMLDGIPDEKEKYRLIKKINFKITKLNIMREKSPLLEETELYYEKLIDKFGKK